MVRWAGEERGQEEKEQREEQLALQRATTSNTHSSHKRHKVFVCIIKNMAPVVCCTNALKGATRVRALNYQSFS